MEKIKVTVEWSGDNYVAATDRVNGIVLVTNKNYDKLISDFEEAFKFHIEGSVDDGDDIPADIADGKYSFEYELLVSAILHRLEGVVSLSALHKTTGINEKQLWHYKSGMRKPRAGQRKRIIKGLHQIGKELMEVV